MMKTKILSFLVFAGLLTTGLSLTHCGGSDGGTGSGGNGSGSVCGNDKIEDAESCDDGNTDANDGCSATCQLETVCGDGKREGVEECDDNNKTAADGCSEICQSEFLEINGCDPTDPNIVTQTADFSIEITNGYAPKCVIVKANTLITIQADATYKLLDGVLGDTNALVSNSGAADIPDLDTNVLFAKSMAFLFAPTDTDIGKSFGYYSSGHESDPIWRGAIYVVP